MKKASPRRTFWNTAFPILLCIGLGLAFGLIAYYEKALIAFGHRVWPYVDLF